MSQWCVLSAECKCNMGSASSVLMVLPEYMATIQGKSMATINEHIPMVNILPFGMCSSLGNPEVVAATAAAEGALTPMPCLPMTSSPWAPGSPTVTLKGVPALNNSSILPCSFGGVIQISQAGQEKVTIP